MKMEENNGEVLREDALENTQKTNGEAEENSNNNNQDWRKMLEKSVQEVQESNVERNQSMGKEYQSREINRDNNRDNNRLQQL